MPQQEFDLLCLDLDDTILDNRGGLAKAWEAVACLVVRADPTLDSEGVLAELRRSTRWFWSDPERLRWGRLDLPAARREIVAHVLQSLGRPDGELAAKAGEVYTDLRDRLLRLHDGALDALQRFRLLFPRLAMVTNGASAVQRAKIDRFRLAPFFEHIQIEEEFGAGKPDPRVYGHVLKTFGVTPARALMVGDDYQADVLGSLEAGMEAAWIDVAGRGTPPRDPPRSHATVRSIAELADRLGA
jgi:putative hydrolase of the HAD superfamily